MKYNISTGVIRSFLQTYTKFIILAVAGLFIFTQFFALMQFSSAATVNENGCDFEQTVGQWELLGDCTASARIDIPADTLVLGHGFTISASFPKTSNSNNAALGVIGSDNVTINNLNVDGTGSLSWPEGLHGINTYESENVQLNNVKLMNMSYSGLLVNGSTVTVNNITTMGNDWNGINVDQGSGVTDPAILTVNGISIHTDLAHIYIDHYASGVRDIVDTNGQYGYVDNPADPNNYTDDRLYTLDENRFLSENGKKLSICHFNNGNGFVSNEPNLSAIDSAHGITDHEEDIIPPYPGVPNGRNWTQETAAIWQNNCSEPREDDGEVEGDVCRVGSEIFMIGDVETSQNDHPADEFTGSGNPGDFSVAPADPFVVGVNTDEEFPWNSNFNQNYATDFDVDFDYTGSDTVTAKLLVSWSPGKSAVENKVVSLDGNIVANLSHTGVNTPGWYNNSQVYLDEVSFELAPGSHTLRFQHTSGDGTFWDYLKLEVAECPQVEEPAATLIATKIVCEVEADLPNWGAGQNGKPNVIGENTATDWLAQREGCELKEGWDFQWKAGSVINPEGNPTTSPLYGEALDWNTFGSTDEDGVVSTEVPIEQISDGKISLREVLEDGYIPFTFGSSHKTNADNVSAEFYCGNNIQNYDNNEWLSGVEEGDTVYCVAWNVPEPPEVLACSVSVFSDGTNLVADYGNANAKVLSWNHPAWTASIPGASWIWSDDPVADPTNETIRTFTKTFYWDGTLGTASIDVAADNDYVVRVNGMVVGSGSNTFGSAANLDITSYIQNGNNTVMIEVTNWAWPTVSAQTNPAGLMYGLTIEGTTTDQEGCGGPTENVGQISGLIFEDFDGEEDQDPEDTPMEGWVSGLFTHNSPYTFVSSFTTGADGEFLFQNLGLGGEYYVCQDIQGEYFQTLLHQAGWSNPSLDFSALSYGDVIGDSELDDLFNDYCYKVELTDENPISANNDFGNRVLPEKEITEEEKEPQVPGVLGASTTKDVDDGGQGGAVLADSDTLSDTGIPVSMFVAFGLFLISSSALVFASVKKS